MASKISKYTQLSFLTFVYFHDLNIELHYLIELTSSDINEIL